jgi:lycopene beta-cyclase
MENPHYIFAGSGLASLMTVFEIIESGKFQNKNILLIDTDDKKTNDRTWCFWNNKPFYWDVIANKTWQKAIFAYETFNKQFELSPYTYTQIRGIDFYNHVLDIILKQKNVTFLNQKIVSINDFNTHCEVKTTQNIYKCEKIFNSIYKPETISLQNKYPLLQQHFIGWFIETKKPVFDDNLVTFMDFSVPQLGNTRFMYVLPTSTTQALVEYTLFSADLLPDIEYEAAIKSYIEKLGIEEYQITDTERGNIPMTSYEFWKNNTKNIINIGSVGGWTKASTGYTFKNATKKSKALVKFLEKESDFRKFQKRDKFWWFDLFFLDVLFSQNEKGSAVFASLFKKENTSLIFKFLDQETTFLEDFQIMLRCPKWIFTKAVFRRIFK